MTLADNVMAASPTGMARVAVIGGGPAGLMAAEALLAGGASVDLYDAMPSVGRKFLLAGKGGLNLTHSEPLPVFVQRFGERSEAVASWLAGFSPQALRDWAQGLGISTFVGTSGRVFPSEMKAAPLLRAWLHRLRTQGLRLHMRHRWQGWHAPDTAGDGALDLRFDTPAGPQLQRADALVLALGGASWPRLGSDGAWVPWLAARGVELAPLQPANCGFDVGWSPYFAERFAGAPLKSVRLMFDGAHAEHFDRPGEFVITAGGIEGSLVYAASALIRDQIAAAGSATIRLDLVPGRDEARLAEGLAHGRGTRSLPNHLREHAGLEGVKAALLRERYSAAELAQRVAEAPQALARELKAWPITLTAARPIAEAISTAGGVRLEALDEHLMLQCLPGVFCAGEMLDWEAPTGGYLLSASLASGLVAGQGVLAWWQQARSTHRRIGG
ncbi:TIGR03862 family flavoprotein [Aquabacterium sp.]|uniref:TIGR03862 family flavoprotein n=1 Tax=Aquabacterium sp. TaxID=1872578 RepID=UPI002CA988C8|nr:TIGR03862 family flavoprotein [Aquabacterium sp.]HSW07260.1 TIGR03862 family flavoprotein [Aquabacterium sp.]